jgi:hypothetical protein
VADCIGWISVTIRPEDVGRRFAMFACVEVKSETGRLSPEQVRFLEVVQRAGGIAIMARSPEDVQLALATLGSDEGSLAHA